jgi:hypothetical protein
MGSIYRTNAFGPAIPPRIQTGGVALYANGTGTASFDHLRWTQYPDPGLSLATVSRCGSTFLNWTANLPSTATTLGIDTSTDGVNWTDSTLQNGQPIPGINQQDPPWVDVFSSNDSYFHYTNVFQGYLGRDSFSRADQSGLGPATDGQIWTVLTAGSPVLAISSNKGTFTGTNIITNIQLGTSTAADMEVLCRVSFTSNSDNVGIALRIVSASMYRVRLNANTIGIGTYAGGTFSGITSTAFTTTPGQFYWLRGRVMGTTIEAKVWADGSGEPGAWTISTTDSSIAGAGGFGVSSFLNSTSDVVTYDTFSAAQVVDTTSLTGQPTIATVDPANSRLTLSSGVFAMYLYNDFTRDSWDLIADMDEADQAGIVFNVVDYLNFYRVVVNDAKAVNGSPQNTVKLFKIAAGVQTQLSTTATISFYRNTYHRLRVNILSGVITVSFDGTQIITYTDSTPLGAGQVGLYVNGSPARYYQFWVQPQGDVLTGTPAGDVVSGMFLYTRARLATTDATVTPQLLDLSTSVFDGNIGPGALIPSVAYVDTFCDKNMDDLCKQSSTYGWYIDPNKALMFKDRNVTPAPWIAQSSNIMPVVDVEADNNLVVDVANDLYRNRQKLKNVIGASTFSDSFQGDSQRRSFTLRYPIAPGTTPTISLNGNSQTVGTKGSSGSQWYYAAGDATIAQDTSGTILTNADTLSVNYTGTYTFTEQMDNIAAQTALAAVEGGTGIVESVEDVSQKNMTGTAASRYANQLITRYGVIGRTIVYKTYRNGLSVGQIQPVFIPEENLVNAQMLITQIDIGVQTTAPNTQLYNYIVTASELPNIGSWAKLLASGIPLT